MVSGGLKAGKWMIVSIPTLIGVSFGLVGLRILRNETRLLIRQIELEQALRTKSIKKRRELMLGNKCH